jgi:putative membrane protein
VKVGLFLLVGVISIYPTLAFTRWKRSLAHDSAWRVPPEEQRRIRRLITIELHLAGMIPVFAVIMSRGLGH